MTPQLDRHAGDAAAARPAGIASKDRTGRLRREGGGVSPDHVERAMREIDHAHDAEDQRQPRRQQEQHDAELQAVQELLERSVMGHILDASSAARPDDERPAAQATACSPRRSIAVVGKILPLS